MDWWRLRMASGGYPVLFDGQEPIRISIAASKWHDRQLIEFVRLRLAHTGLHDTLSSPAAFTGLYFLSPNPSGLHWLVDSTGVKMLGEGERKTKKHGADYRRQWRKVHLGMDAETLEIRAIEVTSNRVGDAQVLPDLLNQNPMMKPSLRSALTVLITPNAATALLPQAVRMPSFPFTRMANPGKKIRQAPKFKTRLYVLPNI